MNQPPPNDLQPADPNEVARKQARLEQMKLESQLEIMRSHRQRRESTVNRRFTFILVFALSGFVAWFLDSHGFTQAQSILGAVVTLVTVGAWWAYRKPYGT